MRPPTPVEFDSGSAATSRETAGAAIVADEAMPSPMFQVEYVLGDGLEAPADNTGYVFDSQPVAEQQVRLLADVFGVTGEPVQVDDGWSTSWRVGPDDGSAPNLWVNSDAMQYWTFSNGWAEQGTARWNCAVSADDGYETVDDCPEPAPPAGILTAADAEQRTAALMSTIGVDPATIEFDTFADDWSATVTVTDVTDRRSELRSWFFSYGTEGTLDYASGPLAGPETVGPYPLVDIETAFNRLLDGSYATLPTGGSGGPMFAADIEPASGEPVSGEVLEPELLEVTFVDVQSDLWWAWDVNGSAWLLPAYRFIGDDGGWYSVPAVTDDYLVNVETQANAEPMFAGSTDSGDVSSPTPEQ